MSNTKNPFEIRTDLLGMAKDYMDKQWEMNFLFAERAIEQLNKDSADYADQLVKLQPKPYTVGELIDKANELYAFVSKK